MTGLPALDQVAASSGIRSIKRVFRPAGQFEQAHIAFGLHLWYELELDTTQSSAVNTIKALMNTGMLDAAEITGKPFRIVSERVDPPTDETPISTISNDQYVRFQWHLRNEGQTGGTTGADIHAALGAWTVETGSPDVTVAIIDGGIDVLHPDLNAALWINTDEIPNNGIDDDQNGYVDDVNGFGFGDNSSTLFPDFHGTHVAGIIGAITNNSIGVAGIAGGSGTANGVRLMSCAIFGNTNAGNAEDALVYAADNGAVIAQNSWGINLSYSPSIEAAINYFIARAGYDNSNQHFNQNIQTGPMAGGIVIFAAGNRNTWNPDLGYPASYPPVMAVASSDSRDVRSTFSNYGTWIDITAPGTEIYSTFPRTQGYYGTLSGTSMACPQASGIAALIVSKYKSPGMHPESIHARIALTAENIDTKNPNYEGLLGRGRLNGDGAIRITDNVRPSPITDLQTTSTSAIGVTVSWTATGDNGTVGKAARYEIWYSTSPINDANFLSATPVLNPPLPAPSGTLETFTIGGLSPSTTYYVILRSIDAFGNRSILSNLTNGRTKDPGVIEVTPASLTANQLTGVRLEAGLTLRNTGTGELAYQVMPQPPAVSWLLANASGILQPAGSTNILVIINSDGMAPGTFTSNIRVLSNDINHPLIDLPVSLTVQSAPNLKLSPGAMSFGEVAPTGPKTLTLTLLNNGTSTLTVNSIQSSTAEFVTDAQDAVIGIGESFPLQVTFTPAQLGERTGTITIQSDDPDQPLATVVLEGRGIDPPRFVLDLDTVYITTHVGKDKIRYFTIQNTGNQRLDGEIKVEFDQPITSIPMSLGMAPSSISMMAADTEGGNLQKEAPGDFTLLNGSTASLATIIAVESQSEIYGYSVTAQALLAYNTVEDTWRMVSPTPSAHTGSVGATQLGQKLYFTFTDTSVIEIYDLVSSSWNTITAPMATQLVTSDQTALYLALGNLIRRYDPSLQQWTSLPVVPFTFSTTGGLVHHRGIVYAYEGGGYLRIAQFNLARNEWTPVARPNLGLTEGIVVDPIHEAIYISTNSNANMVVYDIRQQSWGVRPKYYFTKANGGMTFLSSGMRGLYYAAGGDDIQFARFEPYDFYWLFHYPSMFFVEPGATRNCELDVLASGLLVGDYPAKVRFTHNDPYKPEIIVPVLLRVLPGPDIQAPIQVEFNDLYVGVPGTQEILITNQGTATLTGIFRSPDPVLTLSLSQFTLSPGQSIKVLATAVTTTEGYLQAHLYIDTNDPDESVYEIFCPINSSVPPELTNLPGPISITLPYGVSYSDTLLLTNQAPNSRLYIKSGTYFHGENETVADQGSLGAFLRLPSSPVPLTGLVTDPATGFVFGYSINGNTLYKYDPSTRAWSASGNGPLKVMEYAGAAYGNGNLYFAPEEMDTIAVYSIEANAWSLLRSTFATGTIGVYGNLLTVAEGKSVGRINLVTHSQSISQGSPVHFSRRGSILSGDNSSYAHSGAGGGFAQYYPYNNTWNLIHYNTLQGQSGGYDEQSGLYLSTYRTQDYRLTLFNTNSLIYTFPHVPEFHTILASMTFSSKEQSGGFYVSEGSMGTGFGIYKPHLRGWLSLPEAANSPLNPEALIPYKLNTRDISIGTYSTILGIATNSPSQPVIKVPITLTVTSAPDLIISAADTTLQVSFVGQEAKWAIKLKNGGTEPLIISSITGSAVLSGSSDRLSIPAGDTQLVNIKLVPTAAGSFQGQIVIQTNDPDFSVLTYKVNSTVYNPPVIATSPAGIQVNMGLDENTSVSGQVQNTGGYPLQWNLRISRPGLGTLQAGLDSLTRFHSRITSKIPGLVDFSGGDVGDHLTDGPNTFNYLRNNTSGILNYTNSTLRPGLGGTYFTSKTPGLFVFGADTGSGWFQVEGNLSSGYTTTSRQTVGVSSYTIGFPASYKVTSGPGKPNMHQILVSPRYNYIDYYFNPAINDDRHGANYTLAPRIYLLMFFTAPDQTLSMTQVEEITVAFMRTIDGELAWLTASTTAGSILPGQNVNYTLTFNSHGLKNGTYNADLNFFSNDPNQAFVKIPVKMIAYTNHPPIILKGIGNLTMPPDSVIEFDLVNYFSEPDNEPLSYAVTSTQPTLVAGITRENTLEIHSSQNQGTATITIKAWDPSLIQVTQNFQVTVKAHDVPTGLEPSLLPLILSPNPASDQLFVTFSIADRVAIELNLLSVRGELLWSHSGVYEKGSHTARVSTTDLTSGLYLLRVVSEVGTSYHRVVIMR